MIIEYRKSDCYRDIKESPVFEDYRAENRVSDEFRDRLTDWMATEFGLKECVETIRSKRQARRAVKRIKTMLTNKLYGEASNSLSFNGVNGEDGRVCIFVYNVVGDYSNRKDDALSVALEVGFFVDTGDEGSESVVTRYLDVSGDNMIDVIRSLAFEIVGNATDTIKRHYENLFSGQGE